MGYTSWVRGFFIAHFLSFFPLALSYTFLANGNTSWANAFMWLLKNWAGYFGWVTSAANLSLAYTWIADPYPVEEIVEYC